MNKNQCANSNTINQRVILEPSNIITIGNYSSKSLNNYFNKIQKILGCTYIFYIYEDSIRNRKIVYSSDWKWQNLLIGENLINDCPVFKAATNGFSTGKSLILLPWNEIHCQTSKEKDITLLRTEYNIANGIGFCCKSAYHREGIGFGADAKDYNFYQRLIVDNLIYSIARTIKSMVFKHTSLSKNIFPTVH